MTTPYISVPATSPGSSTLGSVVFKPDPIHPDYTNLPDIRITGVSVTYAQEIVNQINFQYNIPFFNNNNPLKNGLLMQGLKSDGIDIIFSGRGQTRPDLPTNMNFYLPPNTGETYGAYSSYNNYTVIYPPLGSPAGTEPLVVRSDVMVSTRGYGYRIDVNLPASGETGSASFFVGDLFTHEIWHAVGPHIWDLKGDVGYVSNGRGYPVNPGHVLLDPVSIQSINSHWTQGYAWFVGSNSLTGLPSGSIVLPVGANGSGGRASGSPPFQNDDGISIYVVDLPTYQRVEAENYFDRYNGIMGRERTGVGASNPHVQIRLPVLDSDGNVVRYVTIKESRHRDTSPHFAAVGSIIGTTFGNYLANGDRPKGIVYSSVLGEIGERLGNAIRDGSTSGISSSITTAGLQQFGSDVALRAGQAAIGSVSSWLSMELGEALGLKGFGAELFTTVGSTVSTRAIANLLNSTIGPSKIWDGFITKGLGKGAGAGAGSGPPAGVVILNAVGSFLGAKLGAMVVSPTTQAGVALSSIGSAVGAYVSLQIGTSFAASIGGFGGVLNLWGNLLFPGVGAFVGFVLGALIGNLFGKKKPKTPTASAETVLQVPFARYELGSITSANGGNVSLVTSMATAARDTLNNLISVVAYTDAPAYVSNLNGVATDQRYGHTGGQIYVKINGTQTSFASADQAVEFGSLTAIRNTKIVGGDIFAKRVISQSAAADLTSLAGDLQIAAEYSKYANNRDVVNSFITSAYATLTEPEQLFYFGGTQALVDQVRSSGLGSLSPGNLITYNANKALIDKVHTQGPTALTASETTFYNTNKVTIDKIVTALESQVYANPWIITLQRADELKLDKFAPSDFYGGLRGFMDSFDLKGRKLGYEHIRISNQGNTAEIQARGGVDLNGAAAQVYRLYDTVLNRAPDPAGQGDNTAYLANHSLEELAQVFLSSVEFGLNGGPYTGYTNDQFVELLYTRALNRASDPAGKASWVGLLTAGESRASVAAKFSETQEHRNITDPAVAGSNRVGSADGLFSILPQAMNGASDNDILNSRFQQNLTGWTQGNYMVADPHAGQNLTGYAGDGNDVLYMSMGGTPATGALLDELTDWIPSVAGVTYEGSVRAAQHRGLAEMYVQFYDANKNFINTVFMSGAARDFGGVGGVLNSFNVISGTATAPAGAAFRRYGLRLKSTGINDPYAFFTQPTSRALPTGVFDWTTRGEAVRIDDLASIGFTARLPSAVTNGNDFVDQRLTTTAVTIDDMHTELVPSGPPLNITVPVQQSGGDDIFIGGSAGDTLSGQTGWDWLDGGGGNDTIYGGTENDVLLGGEGQDHLEGGAGDDYLSGGAGDDNPWTGTRSDSWLDGGDGNDTIALSGGYDMALGGNGDDTFLMEQDGSDLPNEWTAAPAMPWTRSDWVNGNGGSDTISYERFTAQNRTIDATKYVRASQWAPTYFNGVQVALFNHPSSWNYNSEWLSARIVEGDFVLSVENVTGSDFNDYIWGDTGDNVLKGGAGDDVIDGNAGNDVLEGGAGADHIFGGTTGGDVTLSYAGSSAGVFVDMTAMTSYGGDADGDMFVNIDHLRGSKFNDDLKGDVGGNRVEGLAGNDWITATAGGDVYDGGDGSDTVDYSGATAGVALNLGGYTPTGTTNGSGTGGLAAGAIYTKIETVVGSNYADSLSGGAGGQTFIGGAGADTLAGGADADTYVFNLGDGLDTITDDNTSNNTVSYREGVKFSDLVMGATTAVAGNLVLQLSSTDKVTITGNFATSANTKIKSLDMNGAGQLDISGVNYPRGGSSGDDFIYGDGATGDLIFGYAGNDYIYGYGRNNNTNPDLRAIWESWGNVIIGGTGNDRIYTSTGDDQFGYDRGDEFDTIMDTGGEDTLVFGSTARADEVLYKVVGSDLYIGLKNLSDATQDASQVADRIKLTNGAVRTTDMSNSIVTYDNLVEFVNAGGTTVDLRKLDIAWVDNFIWTGSYLPIVLDLKGDGLDLNAIATSDIVAKSAGGGLSRVGWVGPTDGFLAVDRNGDGQINRLSEISFVQDRPGATSDLEGLLTWDTNGDGVLDKSDKDFDKLLLFVDANQNGRSTAKELQTLAQAGIISINLKAFATGYTAALTTDSFVQNTFSFTRSDGTTGDAYDVALGRRIDGVVATDQKSFEAVWGTRSDDAEFGRLSNDPVADATAARSVGGAAPVGATRTLNGEATLADDVVDVATLKAPVATGPLTYSEIAARTQVTFADTDVLAAEDAERWADKLDPARVAARLADGADGFSGEQYIAGLLAERDQAIAKARYDQMVASGLIDDNQPAAAAVGAASLGVDTASLSVTDGTAPIMSTDGPASSLLAAELSAPYSVDLVDSAARAAPAPEGFATASAYADSDWWRPGAGAYSPITGGYSLAQTLAAWDQTGSSDAAQLGWTGDASAAQGQQLLRQSLAGFGGDGGGSAAVWRRSGDVADAALIAQNAATWSTAIPKANEGFAGT